MSSPVIAKRGYKGPAVERVQKQLNKLSHAGLEPDGWFGENTERAAIKFQTDNGFMPDGVIGLFTNAALTLTPLARRLPTIPPHVRQEDSLRCWAAATESWLRVQPSRTNFSMDDIVEGMRADGFARPSGALPVSSERIWEERFGLRPIKGTAKKLFAESILQRLSFTNKPVLIGIADAVGHVVVCFGVSVAATTPFLLTMDPLKATHPNSIDLSDLHTRGSRRVMTWLAGPLPLFP